VALLGMAGMELSSNCLGAGQRGRAEWCLRSAQRCYSFRYLAAQPRSQTLSLLPDRQSDVYSFLIVSSECCKFQAKTRC
jgi:hypothetical protein